MRYEKTKFGKLKAGDVFLTSESEDRGGYDLVFLRLETEANVEEHWGGCNREVYRLIPDADPQTVKRISELEGQIIQKDLDLVRAGKTQGTLEQRIDELEAESERLKRYNQECHRDLEQADKDMTELQSELAAVKEAGRACAREALECSPHSVFVDIPRKEFMHLAALCEEKGAQASLDVARQIDHADDDRFVNLAVFVGDGESWMSHVFNHHASLLEASAQPKEVTSVDAVKIPLTERHGLMNPVNGRAWYCDGDTYLLVEYRDGKCWVMKEFTECGKERR